MKHPDQKIINLIQHLKVKYPQFIESGGLGYCANASEILQSELKAIGIESKLLYGQYLKDNYAANQARGVFINFVKNFPIGTSFHGRVKSAYKKNNNKLSNKGGHVVVLVDNYIYDVTSAQFGLPIHYSIDTFKELWREVHTVEIKLKPEKTSWNQKVVHTYQTSASGDKVALEGLIDTVGPITENAEELEFNRWFTVQSKRAQSNSTIVTPELLGQDYMLHIDKNTPSKFIPMMPRSAGSSEDNTVARVTVAPTLIGCIMGYARAEYDFQHQGQQDAKSKDKYRGGYEICELKFTYCLKPNEKLVYDAVVTGEHWLVCYNKNTMAYIPTKVGEMFIKSINYENVGDKNPRADITFYVSIIKEDGFMLTSDIKLDKGQYTVTYSEKDMKDDGTFDKVTYSNITVGEYNTAKSLCASMLSMESIKNKKIKVVIIKGNPRYINTQAAKDYYNDIYAFLKQNGATEVIFDEGVDGTLPDLDADMYVAHSRGCGRFKYMPDDKKKTFLRFGVSEGITHPTDLDWINNVYAKGTIQQPPPEHFEFIDAQKEAIITMLDKIKKSKENGSSMESIAAPKYLNW